MKERQLMTSFFLANVSDLATTAIGLGYFQGTELNPIANDFRAMRDLLQIDNVNAIVITKLAVTTTIISLYALSQESNSRFKFPTERAMKMGNILVWSIVCWNVFNVGVELIVGK